MIIRQKYKFLYFIKIFIIIKKLKLIKIKLKNLVYFGMLQ